MPGKRGGLHSAICLSFGLTGLALLSSAWQVQQQELESTTAAEVSSDSSSSSSDDDQVICVSRL